MKLRLDDGCELFYTIDDFTDPWTEPETVVMHHGMAKNHKLWFGWVPIVARHYRVIRFDMRGMGQSDVPEPGYPWSVDNFARTWLSSPTSWGWKSSTSSARPWAAAFPCATPPCTRNACFP